MTCYFLMWRNLFFNGLVLGPGLDHAVEDPGVYPDADLVDDPGAVPDVVPGAVLDVYSCKDPS